MFPSSIPPKGSKEGASRALELVRYASNESLADRSTNIEQLAGLRSWGIRAVKTASCPADDERMKRLMRVSVGLETTEAEVSALERIFRLAEIPALVDEEIARFS